MGYADYDTDDTDLPDHHYESIYGRAAMQARLLARLDALLQRMDARTARLAEQNRRWDARLTQTKGEAGH
jgi:alpha-D-ribose 1-methylphosphonate 5-triphosphate synthase subunit PhnG